MAPVGLQAADDAIAPPAKPATRLEDLLPDPVIAKGTGFEIKQSELDEVVTGLKARSYAVGQPIPPERLPLLQRELMDGLIQMRILNQNATAEQKARGLKDGEKRYQEMRRQATSEENFNLKVKAIGMTPARVRATLNEEAIAKTVMRDKVNITDDDLKKYYEENPSEFERPEIARVLHILMVTRDPNTGAEFSDEQKREKRKEIESLLKRARAGEDFGALAKDFSEDPAAKEKGGEIKFPRSSARIDSRVPPEFESAAFSLKTNQISDVVVSTIGFHIIKLLEKTPARRVELAEVKDDLKLSLEQREVEKILPKFYAQLKQDAKVEILDPQLKALEDAAAAEAAAASAKPDKPGAGKQP